MKKLILITSLILFSMNNVSQAQKSNVKVAVIDIEEVLKNSIVMKHVQKQISAKEKLYQSQINKKQHSLEKEFKKIESKKSVLSKSALKEEEKKFSKNFNKLKNELETKQKSLKKAYVKAISKLDKKINSIVTTISKQKNIDLIFPASGLISHKDELDISSEVLKKLNKEMKTITISFD